MRTDWLVNQYKTLLAVGAVSARMISLARARLPNYAAIITFWNLGLALGMVVLIAAISSYVGVRKY